MTKISSGNTRFYKKIFPVMWFGILTVFLIATVSTGALEESTMLLLVPLAMGVFGFFFPNNFGTEIAFSSAKPFSINPFARSEIVEDLIVRVDRARTRR
jgi:hypothetical protein